MTATRRLAVVAALVAAPALTLANDKYTPWTKYQATKQYTCSYEYKTPTGGYSKQTVAVYYDDKDRNQWAYYYNADSKPWARCAIPGNPKYNPKVMYWENLTPDATAYEPFKDPAGKPYAAGYCPTAKDGVDPIPTLLPLPPK